MALPSDKELLKQWHSRLAISCSVLNKQYINAKENHAYHAGQKEIYFKSAQDKDGKGMVVFNKVKPFVDAVTGFMVQLRRKPQYIARVTGDKRQEAISMYTSGISDYLRENCDLPHIESRQDREFLICGYAAVDTNITYEQNPDGEVAGELIRYNDVGWDPQAEGPNLIDARWVFRRKAYNKEEALDRFSNAKEEDFEQYDQEKDILSAYDHIGKQVVGVSNGESHEDLVQVYYYQWWDLEDYYRAENPLFDIAEQDPAQANLMAQMMVAMRDERMDDKEAPFEYKEDIFDFDPLAETLVMSSIVKKDMELLFSRFGVDFEYQKYKRKVYYTAIVTGDKVLDKFKSPHQEGFTIKFKTANYDPTKKLWYGLVESLKEPSRYANKAVTEMLSVIASNSKGGVMYEESAVIDKQRFEQSYARNEAAIAVADGALSANRIVPKAQPALPSGYENIYSLSQSSLTQVSGVGQEFMGLGEGKAVSALLESRRVNQVISTLATYFDAVALYQKNNARLMLTYIRMLAENAPNRLVRILGDDGAAEYKALNVDNLAEEYDITIGEVPVSATQRQETAQIMLSMADRLTQIDPAKGVEVYQIAIDYTDIKEGDKQRFRRVFEVDPAQAQAQAEAAQRQQAEQTALNQALMAAQESQAQRNYSQALLNEAKMIEVQASAQNKLAEVDETKANVVKTLAEAEKTSAENDTLRNLGANSVNVTI